MLAVPGSVATFPVEAIWEMVSRPALDIDHPTLDVALDNLGDADVAPQTQPGAPVDCGS
jgi:hypothetical protein